MLKFLLSKITNNPAVIAYVAGICFAAGMISAGTVAWKVQGWRLDAVQSKFDMFVSQTEAQGKLAQADADAKDAKYKRDKEIADENLKKLEADNADLTKRLLHDRASRSTLSKATALTGHSERACFKRSELESARSRLNEAINAGLAKSDERFSAISGKGQDCRIGLDSARAWAKSQ
jgi:hypothetical protein